MRTTGPLVPSRRICGGNLSRERLALQPGAENIPRCINIAIVRCAAARTIPAPYSNLCDTFWASARTARGTQLGSHVFAHFDVSCSVPAGFIAEHETKHAWPHVVNRGGHMRARHWRYFYRANNYRVIFSRHFRGRNVKMMAATVCYLCMQRPNTPYVPRAISNRKLDSVSLSVTGCLYSRAITAGRNRRQSKIHPNLANAKRLRRIHLALKNNVPASARILDKSAFSNLATKLAGPPETHLSLQINHGSVTNSNGSSSEWDPTQRTPWAGTPAIARTSLGSTPLHCKLTTNTLDGVAMQPKRGRAAGAQLNQIKRSRPAPIPLLGVTLRIATIVPNRIHGHAMPGEDIAQPGVLQPILVAQENHAQRLHRPQRAAQEKTAGDCGKGEKPRWK